MFTIEIERTGDVAVARCTGRIVRGDAVRNLRETVVSERDIRVVVLDLSDVRSLDAGGLTALVSLHLWARHRGIQLKLVNPCRFVREMFERTHLNCVFDISSLETALQVLREPDYRGSRNAAWLIA